MFETLNFYVKILTIVYEETLTLEAATLRIAKNFFKVGLIKGQLMLNSLRHIILRNLKPFSFFNKFTHFT